jgi:hypothetical protein
VLYSTDILRYAKANARLEKLSLVPTFEITVTYFVKLLKPAV